MSKPKKPKATAPVAVPTTDPNVLILDPQNTDATLAHIFTLSPGDVLQADALMPSVCDEPLEAQVLQVDAEKVLLSIQFFGIELAQRTCRRLPNGFTWN